MKDDPLEIPAHHWPDCSTRPAISDLPSLLKSPTCTSTQVTLGFQVVQRLLVKDVPLEIAAHHWPACENRPMRSVLPSPLKSPTRTSTQLTAGFHTTQAVVPKAVEPFEIP